MQNNRMSLNNEKRNKWSIRRLSGVGVASVIVASSMIGGAAQVNAAELKTNKLTEVKESRDILQPKNIDEINKKLEMTGKSIKKSDMMTENSKVEKKVADNKAEPKSQDKNMKHKHEMTKPEDVKKSVSENIKDKIDVPASYLENAKYPGPFTAGVNQVIPYEAFGGDGMLTRLLLKSSDKAPWSDNGTAKHPGLLPLDKLTNGHYFYNVELDGKAKGKSDKALLEQLKANGTQSYSATVKVYGSKNGKPDLSNVIATKKVTINLKGMMKHEMTKPEDVKKSVSENIKDKIDVPASYLENAKYPGPFTAGVNQVIPYEAFGGDGMLTRLLLKSSDKAPWSDNGTAKHPGLLPLDKLTNGHYFYNVELDGKAKGKSDKALLEQLKANGTQSYSATVKVYGSKNGKPDLSNVIATKKVTINLKGMMKHEMTKPEDVKKSVSENIKDKIDVPASYLENAKYPGPFTAGVNQVIPYEAFGGDGMLTRLLLKSSDKAPWSDNGTAKHPGLLPLDKLTNGHYFYNVELDGKAKGKSDKALLEQLKANGTQSYSATVKVYGSKNGKPDLSNVIATKKVTINLKGMMKHEMTKPEDVKKSVSENIKDKIDVPASYLENAKYPGPFTAGVNQVIPYEAFGGDGMLTRLLLKSSDKALWSDNGTAKHPGLLPLDKLTNGHYFYNVELDGKAKGKSDKALLEQLKANGTQSYSATVKVYGSKNGKPDLSNVIATKKVTINLKGKHNHKDHNHNGHNPTDPMNKGHMGMGGHHGHHMHSSNTNQNGSQLTNSTTNQGTLSNGKTRLPNTGQSETNLTLAGIIGLIFASILGFFAIKRKNR